MFKSRPAPIALTRDDLASIALCYAGPTDANKPYYRMEAKADKSADLYLYDVIGSDWYGGTSAKQFAADLNALGKLDTLNVFINSPGGQVWEGVAIYNILIRNRARKVVHVDGLAGSIASIIAMAGDEIIMAKNAMMMIHNPYALCMGNANELRAIAEKLDKTTEVLTETYVDRSGTKTDQIKSWMDAETWFDAEEAVSAGLADSVSKTEVAVAAMATFDLSKFRNVPSALVSALNASRTAGAQAAVVPAQAPVAAAGSRREEHPAMVKVLAHMAQRKAGAQRQV